MSSAGMGQDEWCRDGTGGVVGMPTHEQCGCVRINATDTVKVRVSVGIKVTFIVTILVTVAVTGSMLPILNTP